MRNVISLDFALMDLAVTEGRLCLSARVCDFNTNLTLTKLEISKPYHVRESLNYEHRPLDPSLYGDGTKTDFAVFVPSPHNDFAIFRGVR